MSNIDWNFILEQEGYKLKGYVPDAKNSKSGVTIASGFDLGQRNENDLTGLPKEIIELLKPFLGFTGVQAEEIAGNLNVNDKQAKIINEFAKSTELAKLKTAWTNATGTSFDELDQGKATVLASVAFQYGNLEKATPNFWKQATSGDWNAVSVNLMNFGDSYSSRRLREARYLNKFAKKKLTEGEQLKAIESLTTIDEQAIRDSVDSVSEVTGVKSTDIDQAGNFITNFISDLQGINEKYKLEGKTELEKIEDEYLEEQEDKAENEELFRNSKETFRIANEDEIRAEIEKQNLELQEYDPLEGHKNPTFLEPLPDVPFVSKVDQFNIDKANEEYQKELEKETSLWDIAGAAKDMEWVSSWLLKHIDREDLNPNHEWTISDFVPNKEQTSELLKGVNPEFHAEIIESGKTLPEMKILANKYLDVQEKEKILMSHGVATGIVARLLAAVLDPTAIAAAIATDGLMAPAIIMNKASRLQRIIRGGFAAATTNAAIEGILVTQNPVLDLDDILIATAAGFVLGGTIRGIRKTKIDENEAAFNKAVDDFKNAKEKELIDDSGLSLTQKGNKKYKKVKTTAQDDYDEVALKYEKTIIERTTGRTDGNVEIRMPDGKDEYIVTKDGKVIKCK